MDVLLSGRMVGNDHEHLDKSINLTQIDKPKLLKPNIVKPGNYDLAIATFFGCGFNELPMSGFLNLKCKKAAWFLDSHAMLSQEISIARHFDVLFIAHSKYIQNFKKQYPNKSVHHLPCGVHRWSIKQMGYDDNKRWDMFIAYNSYPVNNNIRDKVLNSIKSVARNMKNHIGTYDYTKYLQDYRKAKVGLNMSLFNDFNIRNIECIANGMPLLTNRTPDHEKITGIDKFCTYYDPNSIKDIFIKYIEALKKTEAVKKDGINWAKKNHSYPARVAEMINRSMSTSFPFII